MNTINSHEKMHEFMLHNTKYAEIGSTIRIENIFCKKYRIGHHKKFTYLLVDKQKKYTTDDINNLPILLQENNEKLYDYRISNSYVYYFIYNINIKKNKTELDLLKQTFQDFLPPEEYEPILQQQKVLLKKYKPLIIDDSQKQCIFVKYYKKHNYPYQLWLTFISTQDDRCKFKPNSTNMCMKALQNAFKILFEEFIRIKLKLNLYLDDDARIDSVNILMSRIQNKFKYKDLSIYSRFGAVFDKDPMNNTDDELQRKELYKQFKKTYNNYIQHNNNDLMPVNSFALNILRKRMVIASNKYHNFEWCQTKN